MLTAKEAREMFDNRDMVPFIEDIKYYIQENKDFAVFPDESVPMNFYGLKLDEKKRNKLLSLGYKVEIDVDNKHSYNFPKEWITWLVTW